MGLTNAAFWRQRATIWRHNAAFCLQRATIWLHNGGFWLHNGRFWLQNARFCLQCATICRQIAGDRLRVVAFGAEAVVHLVGRSTDRCIHILVRR